MDPYVWTLTKEYEKNGDSRKGFPLSGRTIVNVMKILRTGNNRYQYGNKKITKEMSKTTDKNSDHTIIK
jgi:hypothetical protein